MPVIPAKSSAENNDVSLLVIRDLAIRFQAEGKAVDAVRGIDLKISKGTTHALVGESGSGKSVTALSVLGLLPYPRASHPSGSIRFEGNEILGVDEDSLRKVRGNKISMIFQEPMTSLNPLHRVSRQIGETLALHQGMRGEEVRTEVLRLLQRVGIRDPEQRLDAYPHQLSGGERQRVMIAMALANRPLLLIADEPTTALDVTVQAEILTLMREIQRETGMAVLMITHDLTIVRSVCDRVSVMQAGKIVEEEETTRLFASPSHEYTKTLLASEPGRRVHAENKDPKDPEIVLQTRELRVHYPIRRGLLRRTVGHVKAVDGVDVSLREGRTLGLVGESGCGKTTLGQALLRLIPSEGKIDFCGQTIDSLGWKAMRPLRRQMQFVFQDPYGSLSPRLSVFQIVAEGLFLNGLAKGESEARERVEATLAEVRIEADAMDRYPHEFSGGQRQRISLARALSLEPRVMILDEPTSSLDLSVQTQILDLLTDIQDRHRIAYIFISHDLRCVRAVADEILVMRKGIVVEHGPADRILETPQTDYTRALLRAAFGAKTTNGEPTQPKIPDGL